MKRILLSLSAIVVLLIMGRSWNADFPSSSRSTRVVQETALLPDRQSPPAAESTSALATTMPVAMESIRLLDAQSDVREDLAIIQQLLQEYRRNLGGNPVGENDEVTAALTGGNEKKLVYLAQETRPLIDDNGRLTDRWGNPYVFHALSGKTMEIRSAGPDGIPYNADDLVSE